MSSPRVGRGQTGTWESDKELWPVHSAIGILASVAKSACRWGSQRPAKQTVTARRFVRAPIISFPYGLSRTPYTEARIARWNRSSTGTCSDVHKVKVPASYERAIRWSSAQQTWL